MVRERRRQQLPQTGYTILVEMSERGDNNDLRSVFIVNMPDSSSPKTEFWMIKFSCNLSHFESDMNSVRLHHLNDDFRVSIADIILQHVVIERCGMFSCMYFVSFR